MSPELRRFVLRRLGGGLLAVVGAALLVFFVRHLVPGDPVDVLSGGEAADPRDKEQVRRCLDLDKPLGGQLKAFARDVGSGSLGHSCVSPNPTVASMIARAFPRTLELAVAALGLALLFALPLGVGAALRQGSLLDGAASAIALAGLSMPMMWLGPLLIFLFYVRLGWLPGPAAEPGQPGALFLPAATLATHLMAMLQRMTRSSMLEVVGEDYVRTARAKGLPARLVIFKHALRNALIPVITVAGIQFGALLAGAIITEKIFARPGLGTLMLDAITTRDWKVVQGVVIVIAISYVIINLLVDLAYGLADPRIRK
ncbi:MAG TPA: ABC transporter permease [Polyangia bacterium]|nr:ABC transporter permease [Polyangia bacterium]